MMCARCVSAVRTEMKSIFAISWFVCPSASSRSTSRSRSESGSASAAPAAPRRRRPTKLGAESRDGRSGSPAATARTRLDDLGVGGLLQHVAARTGVERLADVARVVLHREHRAPSRAATACEERRA